MKSGLKEKILGSLVTGLFILSIIISFKYTTFLDMTVSMRFMIYPFITLCLLLLWNTSDSDTSYLSVITTGITAFVIAFLSKIIVCFNSQNMFFDLSGAINTICNINIWKYLLIIFSFLITNFIMITISDYFKKIGHNLIGVILGTVTSILMFGMISTIIYNSSLEANLIFKLIISDLIINMIMSIIVIGTFYLFKEKDNIYNKKCFINEINYFSLNIKEDKSITDIMNLNEKKKLSNEKSHVKKKKSKKTSKKSVNE